MAYLPVNNQSVSGTVGASIIGLPYFGVAGSVATVGTGTSSVQLLGIPSISGTVNIGTQSGSVVAFQSDPTKLLTHSSVSGNINVAGSVMAFPTGNQSVSGTIGASIIGLPYFGTAGSVAAVQMGTWGTSVYGVGGTSSVQLLGTPSISGAVTLVGNASVSGTVGASIIGLPYFAIAGSVATVGTAVANQSVSGTVGASIIGLPYFGTAGSVAAVQVTSPWIVNMPSPSVIAYQLAGSIMTVGGTVTTSGGNSSVMIMPGQNAIGSVATLQGTNPWVVNVPTPSYLSIQPAGSVMNVNISGSVATVGTAAANQSVSGTVGASIIGLPYFGTAGSVAAVQVTSPWIVNVPTPSYIAYQLAGSIMATSATVNTGNSSVQVLGGVSVLQQGPWVISGSVAAAMFGTQVTSVVNTIPSSMLVGASVYGNVGAYQIGTWGASVQLTAGVQPIGSVAVLQGTNPWVVSQPSGSIIATQVAGSILMANSPATFAANSAWTQNKSVMATGAVRNDTLASMTAADKTYSPFAVGPSGETIVANSPITKWVSGATSIMYGASVQVLAAPGASIFNYITGIQVINESATASRVTFTEGLGGVPASMMAWAIAPAGGGSNMKFGNPIKTTLANMGVSASISGVSSVFVTIQGFTANQLT